MSSGPIDHYHHELAHRICALRLAAKFTQAQLGAQLFCSQGRIAHWETGRGAPKLEQLGALASALGCTIGYLVTGSAYEECQGRLFA